MSGDDANEKFSNGANLVQLYSGLVFRGPSLVRECMKRIDVNSFA
jgi:dihydroorotate dehydrogenase